MKLLTKYVAVRVLYSDENASNLEIGHFFLLIAHGATLFMIQKWTATSTNISIIQKEIQICIFKVNDAWENSAFKAFEIVSFKKGLCSP